MINNIQDYFLKYKQKLSSKKQIENTILELIFNSTNLKLNSSNIKIDIKNKSFKIVNLRSSVNFLLKDRLLNNDLSNKIKENTGFTLN